MGRRRKPGALSQRAVSGDASAPIRAAGPTPRRRAIFTIVSCNYIAYAVTLMQSVRDFHPETDRFIVLADSYREFPGLDAAADLIFCDEIGIELISNMQLWYSVIEFNTAIKPFVFRHLFDRFAYDEVVYLDPDILLFRPMVEVFDGLGAHNIVLIPHIMEPLQDGKEPSDLSIMKSGVYNLGFLGVRNDPEARALIAWWGERCYLHCRVDVAGHMFTDQRWMDLAPTFVPNPLILRHPGYNVAYWNLAHRRMEQDGDGTWLVNGGPLVFFHFSGISPEDPTVFSKHQNRFTAETLGPVSALCEFYRQRVIANGWEKVLATSLWVRGVPQRPSDRGRHASVVAARRRQRTHGRHVACGGGAELLRSAGRGSCREGRHCHTLHVPVLAEPSGPAGGIRYFHAAGQPVATSNGSSMARRAGRVSTGAA